MSRYHLPMLAVVLAMLATPGLAADHPDRDGDGIWDQSEEVLGTDPGQPERLQLVLENGQAPPERRQQDSYDATKDFTRIEFCHVGDDRYLWRVTFAKPPHLDDTVFHLYVDADADESTGRKVGPGAPNHGTEYMLSIVGGRGTSSAYGPDGVSSSGPPVSHVVQGNTLLISADVQIGRDQSGVRFALYVLCHTATSSGRQRPRMSDSSRKTLIAKIPVSSRPKRMRPSDYTDNYRVSATFGTHVLQRILRDEQTITIPHDQLQADGFSIDQFTTRRWPHVRLDHPGGKVWTAAPQAGRFYVGFMMYDDSNNERVAVVIDGELQGVAVANQDNNTTWLYWLTQSRAFQGGERVELRAAGSGGKHGIANILFLPTAPEPRAIQYTVEHLTGAPLPVMLSPGGPPLHTPDSSRTGSRTERSNEIAPDSPYVISWTTTWPCATRFEYGTNTTYGTVVQQEGRCLVHRVVLDRLDSHQQYHGRAVGTRRDASTYYSEDFVFSGESVPLAATRQETVVVPLHVQNPHDVAAQGWPITTGVPVPQAELGSADHVRLTDEGGREVTAQIEVTGRWPDNSIKWLLITFQADVAAASRRDYRLEYGRQVRRANATKAVMIRRDGEDLVFDTGPLQFHVDRHGNIAHAVVAGRQMLAAGKTCRTTALETGHQHASTEAGRASVIVEEAGPVRAVVKVTSHLATAAGGKLFRIEKRIIAYRELPIVFVQHTFVMDRAQKFTELESLTYHVPFSAAGSPWQLATTGGQPLRLDATRPHVWQRFDNEFQADNQPAGSKGRITGGAIGGPGAVAVRDFWQNYPKGFSLGDDGLNIDLCPDFEAGLYDRFPFEKEGHHLYYYLLDGHYRLKRGVAKTHELMICFDGSEQREAWCTQFQRPLLATAPGSWYCDSKAFYNVAPRDEQKFKLYEQAIDRNLEAYRQRRERQHDFGMLNYGDWYGERGTNWGNIEYDTQHAFFLEFIRSGNPAAFFAGAQTELHNRDVDTVQWSDKAGDVGGVYVHQMCHVGEYYDQPVPGSPGFPRGGFTVSHAWVEGHFDHFFLTGDRRSRETGCAVADFFVRKELGRPYDFSSTRTPGWHLIMLASAYHATGDPYYLNAARVVVDHVLETQDVEPRPLPDYQQVDRQPYQLGGWTRMMVPGHCQCEPRHRGNAGFMIAVLLSGLTYYHDVTGDPRVKEAIIRGARYLLDETYSDEVHGFRYTSCPNTGYRPGATPLMVEGIARAYRWTGDERFRRVLTESLPLSAGGSSYGKSFSMYYRCGPRVLADLDAAGLALDRAGAK